MTAQFDGHVGEDWCTCEGCSTEEDKMEETYDTLPKCPNCGHFVSDPNELFTKGNECAETECGNCEMPITIIERRSVNYITKPRGDK